MALITNNSDYLAIIVRSRFAQNKLLSINNSVLSLTIGKGNFARNYAEQIAAIAPNDPDIENKRKTLTANLNDFLAAFSAQESIFDIERTNYDTELQAMKTMAEAIKKQISEDTKTMSYGG